MKRQTVAIVALATGLLTACGGSSPSNTPANSAPSTSSAGAAQMTSSPAAETTTSASTPAETTPAAPDGGESLTKPFGSTFTWDNGVALTLSAPKVVKATETMSMLLQNKALNEIVVMDATLVNGSKEPLSPMMVHAQATTGEGQAEAVFDTGSGIDMPTADILPGKTAKYKVAFAREKGKDFVVQVSNNSDFTAKDGYYQ